MARILCVGSAVLDLVFDVPHLPAEDEELRAATLRIAAGGNAANTARVLRAIGHEVALASVLADHPSGSTLEERLRQDGVDLAPCRRVPGLPPVSVALISPPGGHRTIVHHRSTPEYDPGDFGRLDLARWDWVHFESRPGPGTSRMVRHARRVRCELPLSIEAEKFRPEAEECFPEVRLVLFSRAYAASGGYAGPEAFLQAQRRRVPRALLTAAWGADGAWGIEADGTLLHAAAVPPATVVDTLGAGDTFNAGVIGDLASGWTMGRALETGCRLAGTKVGRVGITGLTG